MIKATLSIITFVTSSICFIDLVRTKKKYTSLAIFIAIVLYVLFIRVIIIIWFKFYTVPYYITFVFGTFFFIYYISSKIDHVKDTCFKNFKVKEFIECDERANKILCLITSITATNIFVNCNYKSIINSDEIVYRYNNLSFIDALNTMTTTSSLYNFLYDNLMLTVIYIVFTLMFVLNIILVFITALIISNENYEYLLKKNILLLCLLPTFSVIMLPNLLYILNYIFIEFNLPMP